MASSNEERLVLASIRQMLDDGLPAQYARPVPDFFEQNRYDGIEYPRKLCMVDIGNTGPYDPLPDHLNYEAGGIAIKTVTYRIYVFTNVLDIKNVNIGKPDETGAINEPGVLDIEQDIYDVINAEPFLRLPGTVLRWKISGADRDAWKAIDTLIGVTISLSVEMGERDRINP